MVEEYERGSRKGERDAACVGMDQCVNGCCLTRTAEIIVSDPPNGYYAKYILRCLSLRRGGTATLVSLAWDEDDPRVPLTNHRRVPFGIAQGGTAVVARLL